MFLFVRFLLGFMLVATSIFLILLVLIQRGRGGGLAGALGGMGGQSAFGTKAGDLFTKITIGVAAFWILLCILSINVLSTQQSLFSTNLGGAAPAALEGLGTTEEVPADIAPPADDAATDPETSPEAAPETTAEPTDGGADSAESAAPAAADPAPPAEPAAEPEAETPAE